MKRKRILYRVVLLACWLLVFTSPSSATLLRYDENDQLWRDLEVQVCRNNGADPDNDYYGTNCYLFVNWILQYEGRGELSGFCYEAYLEGLDSRKIGQYLNANNNGNGPSEATVRAAFQNAHHGDVVQMRWAYNAGDSNMHTAMINGFEDDGVYFFQSHVSGYGVKRIKNSYYSYAELARRFTNPGWRGGFTIYDFTPSEPDESSARDKVVAYAWEIYNFTWTADRPILLHNTNTWIPAGTIRGIPYTLNWPQNTFEEYKKLIEDNKNGRDNGLYSTATYSIGKDEDKNDIWRTSMKYGTACAAFVTDCIRQGFLPNTVLSKDATTGFHKRGEWLGHISTIESDTIWQSVARSTYTSYYANDYKGKIEADSYAALRKLRKGDYLDNWDHVILVVQNDTSSGKISYIDQTPVWDSNNHVGTHKGEYSYATLVSNYYVPMYVDYPGDSSEIPIDEIPIDSEHFPDYYFREYVKNFDTNGNGYFSQNELDAVTEMWEENGPHPDNGNPNNGNYGYEWIKIESIEGIKLFRNLKYLCVYRDNIKEINLSGMEHLEKLYCYGNKKDEGYGNRLTKLNLKNCSSLQELRCEYNQIQTLDLEGCTALRNLNAINNQLKTLNLKGCKSLYELYATNNKLTEINVDGCTSLQLIYVGKNSFEELRLSAMSAVRYIAAHKNPALKCVYVNNNPTLQTLVLNDCPALKCVYAENSRNISGISIDGDTNLRIFERASNVTVPGNKPTITTSSLPDAYVGESYSAWVSASAENTNTPITEYSISSISSGWEDVFQCSDSGKITGKPSKTGTLKISLRAKNYVGVGASKSFTINVIAKPSITTSQLSSNTLYAGDSFSVTLEASSSEAVTWSISNGSLPAGLSLNRTTGTISGTLTSLASLRKGRGQKDYTFTVKAANKLGYNEKTYTLTVREPFKIITPSLEDAYKNEDYTAEICAEGGYIFESAIDFITWEVNESSLPTGLKFTYKHPYNHYADNHYERKAIISGKPSVSGTFSIKIVARDVVGLQLDSKTFTLTIKEKPAITTASTLSEATVNRPYSVNLVANGTKPITWTRTGGSLPPGMTLGNAGTLSGTPSSSGSYTFTVQASNGLSDSREFKIIVRPSPSISDVLKDGVNGASYSDYVAVSGGVSPFSWSISSGFVPPDTELTYSGTTATLAGTLSQVGTYNFTLKVTDKNGAYATKALTVNVTQTTVNWDVPVKAARGSIYTGTPVVSGGTSPYNWSISSGKLPNGLGLNESTGEITGKPTKAGTFNFTVKATDKNSVADTKAFTVKITQTTLSGTIPTTGIVKASYTGALKVTGGTSAYTWSISKGALPDDLKINASTGKITGKPTKSGTFSFTVKVTDKNGIAATKAFKVKVSQTKLTLTVPETIIRGKSYTWTPKAEGGTEAYKWTISKGTLPNGLKIDASSGKITGKPTKEGTFSFTVKVTDKNGIAATKAFKVKVTQTTLTATIPETIVRGKSYTWTPKVTGGTSSYKWTISKGKLPTGLSINASTGKITGKPTKAGTFKFTVKVTDKNGVAATKAFTVKVTQTTLGGTIPTKGIVKASYTGTLKASGGTSAYTWSISKGTLPNGLKIAPKTGKITGTPTKAGTFNFTVKVADKNGVAATKAFKVKITAATVSGTIPAAATLKTFYTWTLKAGGGTSPYTWTISKGSLPTGMKITASTGKITGKPTKAGTFTFTVKAKDKNGSIGTKAYTVEVTSQATSKTATQSITSDSETDNLNADSLKSSIPSTAQTETLTALQGNGTITLAATLNVASDDILETYEGRDSDLVKVKAGQPLTFIIGEWNADVSSINVYVDDKAVEGLTVEDSKFTLPAEMVHDDFKVSVKAQSEGVEHESEELYIISE